MAYETVRLRGERLGDPVVPALPSYESGLPGGSLWGTLWFPLTVLSVITALGVGGMFMLGSWRGSWSWPHAK